MTEFILFIIAGLVLFLFAVKNLSETLRKTIGSNADNWIKKFTSNSYRGLLAGIIVTILLDSSSAVIIITIVLVNSKILTFRNAMGIVLGANIGTAVSSQIIALDLEKHSPIILFLGFILMIVYKTGKMNNIGKIILYFGMVFFGLFLIETTVEPMKDEVFFSRWLKKTENPLWGSAIGAIVTMIIQSSSATIGMAIILAKKGVLSLAGGIAIMLGAELGTCSDTLISTINGSRAALKTGIFHLVFNLSSIIIGLLLFYQFVDLVKVFSNGASVETSIANAHMFFNIFGVFIFFWTIPFFERIFNKILPEKNH